MAFLIPPCKWCRSERLRERHSCPVYWCLDCGHEEGVEGLRRRATRIERTTRRSAFAQLSEANQMLWEAFADAAGRNGETPSLRILNARRRPLAGSTWEGATRDRFWLRLQTVGHWDHRQRLDFRERHGEMDSELGDAFSEVTWLSPTQAQQARAQSLRQAARQRRAHAYHQTLQTKLEQQALHDRWAGGSPLIATPTALDLVKYSGGGWYGQLSNADMERIMAPVRKAPVGR